MGIRATVIRQMQMLVGVAGEPGVSTLYPKADGKWYTRDGSALEQLVGPTPVVTGVPTRMGRTGVWPYYGDQNNAVVIFEDGQKANVGDFVISTHPNSPGQVSVVLSVNADNTANLDTMDFVRFGLSDPTPWASVGESGQPTFGSGWSNYGGVYQTAQFRRDGKQVWLRGLVKTTTGSVSDIFVLPAAFRPAANELVSGVVSALATGPQSAGTAHTHNMATTVRLDLLPSGSVRLATAVPANSFVSLSSIMFEAA